MVFAYLNTWAAFPAVQSFLAMPIVRCLSISYPSWKDLIRSHSELDPDAHDAALVEYS